jgi:type IV secretory pathway TrbD component
MLCGMGVYLLIAIVSGAASAVIALMKDRSAGWFFVLGFLLPLVGLLCVTFAARGDELNRHSLSRHL